MKKADPMRLISRELAAKLGIFNHCLWDVYSNTCWTKKKKKL